MSWEKRSKSMLSINKFNKYLADSFTRANGVTQPSGTLNNKNTNNMKT